jgi:hypothetical protein
MTTDPGAMQEGSGIDKYNVCKVTVHAADFPQKIGNFCSRETDKIRQPLKKL